jgi:hypothetical protein
MTKTVPLSTGKKVTVNWNEDKGVLDSNASDAFTRGYCHCFAAELHDRTGWPIVALGGFPGTPGHFVVYSPEHDDYIDIDGIGALERFPFQAKGYIEEWEREELAKPIKYYQPLDTNLAKPFVTSVLEEINQLPKKHSTERAQFYLNKKYEL